MSFVELSSDLIKQVMTFLIFKNYIGTPFHTASCLNIISLHSRPLNSPNLHTYHDPSSKPVASLLEIGYLFPQFVLKRPFVGVGLQWLLPLNGTDSHNWSEQQQGSESS